MIYLSNKMNEYHQLVVKQSNTKSDIKNFEIPGINNQSIRNAVFSRNNNSNCDNNVLKTNSKILIKENNVKIDKYV